MPTLEENTFFTPITVFEVAPEQQQALIKGMADEMELRFTRYEGFVAAIFHASKDGRRVVNYAQWRSEKDWEASLSASDNEETSAKIRRVLRRCAARQLEVGYFRVERVVEKREPQKA